MEKMVADGSQRIQTPRLVEGGEMAVPVGTLFPDARADLRFEAHQDK